MRIHNAEDTGESKMSHEQNLFWYGMKASAVQFLGIVIFVLSFLLAYIHYSLVIIGIIIGIFTFFKGKAMRFEYKMKSGNIIHRGDW